MEAGAQAHKREDSTGRTRFKSDKKGPLSAENDSSNPFAHEYADHAEVWELYKSTASAADRHLKDVLNSELDTLLIFAGLFSAVLSTFLVDARKNLRQDPQDVTNSLLLALLKSGNGSLTLYIPPEFVPSLSSRIVNGLWFSSLLFSLLSALGASLSKSWVADYAQADYGANADDARRRHHLFLGIVRWRLQAVIRLFPIFLHISFFLFLVGLSILVLGDYVHIGSVISIFTLVAILLYLGSATLPVFYSDCPYRTPLSTMIINFAENWVKIHRHVQPPSGRSKVELLIWLHDASLGTSRIYKVIQAIAGIPPQDSDQHMLRNSRLVETLCKQLSNGNPEEITVHSCLLAMLHLLRTGYPPVLPVGMDEESSRTMQHLTHLIGAEGYLHDCNHFPPGIREIAVCVKGRIMLRYGIKSSRELFSISIPMLIKTASGMMYLTFLQEVYILSLNENKELVWNLHSQDVSVRSKAYLLLDEKARGNVIARYGYEKIVDGINSSPPAACCKYLKAVCILISRDPRCLDQSLSQMNIDMLIKKLKGPSDDIRDEAVGALVEIYKSGHRISTKVTEMVLQYLLNSESSVRIRTCEWIVKFSALDEFRKTMVQLNGTERLLKYMHRVDSNEYLTGLKCIERLCAYDNIRKLKLSVDITQEIVGRLSDSDWKHRVNAVHCIKHLSVIDNFLQPDLSKDIVNSFIETPELFAGNISFLWRHDHIKDSLTSVPVIKGIIQRLTNSRWDIYRAACDYIKFLCQFDDVLSLFLNVDNLTNVTDTLYQSDMVLRLEGIQCIHILSRNADVRKKILSCRAIEKIVQQLSSPVSSFCTSALVCIKALCQYNDFRSTLASKERLQIVHSTLFNSDSSVTSAALGCILELLNYGDINETIAQLAVENLDKTIDDLRHSNTCLRALNYISVFQYDVKFRRELISLNGIEQILETIYHPSIDEYVSQGAVECIRCISIYNDIRQIVISTENITKMFSAFTSPDLRKQQTILSCFILLNRFDDFREALSSFENLYILLVASYDDELNELNVLECVQILSGTASIRQRMISPDIMEYIMGILPFIGKEKCELLLKSVEILSRYRDLRTYMGSINIVHRLLYYVMVPNSVHFHCGALNYISIMCQYKEVRQGTFTNATIVVLLEALYTAQYPEYDGPLGCLRDMCRHEDVRQTLVVGDIIKVIDTGLSQHGWRGRWYALHYISIFIDLESFKNLIPKQLLTKVVESMHDSDANVRQMAVKCIKMFLEYDLLRKIFVSSGHLDELIEKLNDSEANVQEDALNCIRILLEHEHTNPNIYGKLQALTRHIQSPNCVDHVKEKLVALVSKHIFKTNDSVLINSVLNITAELMKVAEINPKALKLLESICSMDVPNLKEYIDNSKLHHTLHDLLFSDTYEMPDRVITAVEGLRILGWD